MATPPAPRVRYFVSTVTPEFRTLRKKVDEVLRFLGFDAESMDIWGTEAGNLRQLLRDKIDQCDGLIQIVGDGYGAEPPEEDPEFKRVSYTQFEFRYAQAKGKKTWLLLAGPESQRDTPVEKLDLPADPSHPDPAGYQTERRDLQAAYRSALRQENHLLHYFGSEVELENAVLKFRNDSEALRQEFREWQRHLVEEQREIREEQKEASRFSRRSLAILLCVLLLIASLGGAVAWWLGRNVATTVELQSDLHTQAANARARAMRDYRAEKERLAALQDADQRQASLARLETEHQWRLASIDRLFETIRAGYAAGEINDITAEFQRILSDESAKGGIDAALAYLAGKEDALLEEAAKHRARRDEEERLARAPLRSLLIAAGAASAEGRPDEASALYAKVLKADPAWAEALEAAGWFFHDLANFELRHGSLAGAVNAAEKASQCATGLRSLSAPPAGSKRLFAGVNTTLGDVMVMRGGAGDSERALAYYQRSLELFEDLLKANPHSAEASRDLSVSLELFENLLKANPQSARASRDVSVSLNKLGDFLASRRRTGDAEQALA